MSLSAPRVSDARRCRLRFRSRLSAIPPLLAQRQTHMNIQHDSQSASLIYPCEKASLHVHVHTQARAGLAASSDAARMRACAARPLCPLPGIRGVDEYENVLVYGARGHIGSLISAFFILGIRGPASVERPARKTFMDVEPNRRTQHLRRTNANEVPPGLLWCKVCTPHRSLTGLKIGSDSDRGARRRRPTTTPDS